MKNLKVFCLSLILIAPLVMAPGCGSTTLDPAGDYNGNKFLYETDAAFLTAKANLNGFVSWEYQNREKLRTNGWGAVTGAADSVRTNAPKLFQMAYAARNAYSNAVFHGQGDPASTSNALFEVRAVVNKQAADAQSATNIIH